MRRNATNFLLLFLAGSAACSSAMAAEPAYTCNPAQGCVEEQGPVFDIGRGAKLALPFGWRYFSYPTAPIPEMAGLREIRAFRTGMVIAISPLPNDEKRVFTESELCGMVSKVGETYVRKSREQAITPVPMSGGDVVACHVSFSAANDGEKPFGVLPNRRHASVTSFAISYKTVTFSVSVVSEQLPDDGYLAAVNAVKQIR